MTTNDVPSTLGDYLGILRRRRMYLLTIIPAAILLAVYLAIFLGLTALAGISFVGLARERPWRRWAQAALWATLSLLAAVYWQTRG